MTPTVLASPPFFLADNTLDADRSPIAVSLPSELTVAQAADILNCSEAHIVRLSDADEIKFRVVDGSRLVQRDSLLTLAQEINEANAAINEIVRENQELGLYDD